ncbi:MAG TPA: glycoside hydrolase family 3 N-terminal domain-containing protein, partial [Chitinophagales bacterium]|nr:glycoside hydrolase family 3 N-terminal domain-containing protein [Chitinophagales bacterium]
MIRAVAFIIFMLLSAFSPLLRSGMHAVNIQAEDPPFVTANKAQQRWVDSVFNKLTPDQRLGQLFMVAAYSNKGEEEKKRISFLVNTHNVGGLIFMQGGPSRQAALTNHYQGIAKVPLMIAMDAEWGLAMRLDSTPHFQRQLMWGAVSDDQVIYRAGLEIARECKRLGVHVSFSPVVDVNNNARNPVIGDRAFGEQKENVARKGIAYMKGLQDGGVLASAKHFPGHGDTDQDSHKTLPTITASRARLDSLELYPFKALINAGVGSVMVAHLNIPALDTTPKLASTLSPKIVTGLLKEELGFKGLIFTDALNMQGVADYYKPGEVDAKALVAGNDVLLFSGNVGEAVKQIKQAIADKEITQDDIDTRVKKILAAKYWLGLTKKPFIPVTGLFKDLNTDQSTAVQHELMAEAITLVRSKDNLIPFNTKLDSFRFASVSIGAFKEQPFQTVLSRYASVKKFTIDKQASKEDFRQLALKLKDYNTVFVSLHSLTRSADNDYGLTDHAKLFVDEIQTTHNTVLSVFGSPYALKFFDNVPHVQAAYINDSVMQRLAAQALFGGVPMRGKLPVTASKLSKAGDGITTGSTRIRFHYPPNDVKTQTGFRRVDSLLRSFVRAGAFPGANVAVLKDGNLIYNGTVGYHTYDNVTRVSDTSVYDVASVTKTTTTTLAVMR